MNVGTIAIYAIPCVAVAFCLVQNTVTPEHHDQ